MTGRVKISLFECQLLLKQHHARCSGQHVKIFSHHPVSCTFQCQSSTMNLSHHPVFHCGMQGQLPPGTGLSLNMSSYSCLLSPVPFSFFHLYLHLSSLLPLSYPLPLSSTLSLFFFSLYPSLSSFSSVQISFFLFISHTLFSL